MNKFLLLLVTIALWGCHGYEEKETFASTTTYNLQPEALKDGDPSKVLYCSSQNDPNEPIRYLIQFVAVKVATNDTVNILSLKSDHLNSTDGGKIFHFKAPDDHLLALITRSDAQFKKIQNGDTVKFEDWTNGKLLMVIQDPKFKDFAENRFPTVIGEIVY